MNLGMGMAPSHDLAHGLAQRQWLAMAQRERLELFYELGPAFELQTLAGLVRSGDVEMASACVCDDLPACDPEDPEGLGLVVFDDDRPFRPDQVDGAGPDILPREDCWEILVRPCGEGVACEVPDDVCGTFRSLTQAGSEFLFEGRRRHEVLCLIAAWLASEHGALLAKGAGAVLERGTGTTQAAFARAHVSSLYAHAGESAESSATSLLSNCIRNVRLSWGRVAIPLQAVFR